MTVHSIGLGSQLPYRAVLDRRRFLLTSLAGVLATPLAAGAQSPAARIGLLGPREEPRFSEIASGLKQGLREQGYRQDTTHIVEGRTRRGDEAAARVTVQALVGQDVTVLFVVGSALARLARETVPADPHRLRHARRSGGGGAGGEFRSSRREHDRSDVRVSGIVRQAAAVAS